VRQNYGDRLLYPLRQSQRMQVSLAARRAAGPVESDPQQLLDPMHRMILIPTLPRIISGPPIASHYWAI
jgi:hypothetical protein